MLASICDLRVRPCLEHWHRICGIDM
ncbi:hypothetical protein F383_10715 [Gossypium arboreum]|uniref:Uncharacterized protein n=1 Tax=Gossypium arboreum TaxID=29729 RepID=A0A0B0P001_GOSAR|nr:hypothetical protein F383_10715 [Gossypium arboreum]